MDVDLRTGPAGEVAGRAARRGGRAHLRFRRFCLTPCLAATDHLEQLHVCDLMQVLASCSKQQHAEGLLNCKLFACMLPREHAFHQAAGLMLSSLGPGVNSFPLAKIEAHTRRAEQGEQGIKVWEVNKKMPVRLPCGQRGWAWAPQAPPRVALLSPLRPRPTAASSRRPCAAAPCMVPRRYSHDGNCI